VVFAWGVIKYSRPLYTKYSMQSFPFIFLIKILTDIFFFRSFTVHLDITKVFLFHQRMHYIQGGPKVGIQYIVSIYICIYITVYLLLAHPVFFSSTLKFTLKYTLKLLLHVSV